MLKIFEPWKISYYCEWSLDNLCLTWALIFFKSKWVEHDWNKYWSPERSSKLTSSMICWSIINHRTSFVVFRVRLRWSPFHPFSNRTSCELHLFRGGGRRGGGSVNIYMYKYVNLESITMPRGWKMSHMIYIKQVLWLA